MSPESAGDRWARLLREIERRGYTTIVEGDDPALAYTVGLASTWNQPETIVFGLPRDVSVPLLDDVAARVASGETTAGLEAGCLRVRTAREP